MSTSTKLDIHQQITNHIVAAIETAGEFQMPWIQKSGGSFARPVNIASKKPYNGVNILSLWVSAQAQEFSSHLWGTYRQWQDQGCFVRKGEKASLIVFYKTLDITETDAAAGAAAVQGERLLARASWVFNAAQVEGYVPPVSSDLPDAPLFDPLARAETFVATTGARIEEVGDRACYIPALDLVRMPERCRFTGSATSTAGEAFYSTLCHELVHWSGAKPRLNRDLGNRFGSSAYAMEELVAELGAAFLCADLGITPEPRADHACYIKNWLAVLKGDKKAVFTAASKASEAATWLLAKSKPQ